MISLQWKDLLRVFSSTRIQKDQLLSTQPSLCFISHICTWLLEKTELWLHRPFLAKWCLFNVLFRFVIAFLPRSSVLFSCSIMSDTLQPHGLQHSKLPCPSPTPGACSNSCPSSRWCHPTSHPRSSPSRPSFNLSQHQGLFHWVSSLHQVAKVLELQFQLQSFQWICKE